MFFNKGEHIPPETYLPQEPIQEKIHNPPKVPKNPFLPSTVWWEGSETPHSLLIWDQTTFVQPLAARGKPSYNKSLTITDTKTWTTPTVKSGLKIGTKKKERTLVMFFHKGKHTQPETYLPKSRFKRSTILRRFLRSCSYKKKEERTLVMFFLKKFPHLTRNPPFHSFQENKDPVQESIR